MGAKIDQVNGRYHAYLDHHFIGMFPTQDKAEKAIEKMHKKNKQIDTNFKNWLFK